MRAVYYVSVSDQ